MFGAYIFIIVLSWLFFFFLIFGCLGSSLLCTGFLQLRRAGATLRCGAWASHCGGFSCCGARAQQLWLMDSRAQAQQLRCTGLVAPRQVGSSPTRARTRVPCIGRRIFNHCTTRGAPWCFLKNKFIYLFLAVLGLHCCAWAFSSCGKWGLLFAVCGLLIAVASVVAEHGLQTCRFQQLQYVGSVAVARRLSCSVACGIFLDQGSNLCPLHWQADS